MKKKTEGTEEVCWGEVEEVKDYAGSVLSKFEPQGGWGELSQVVNVIVPWKKAVDKKNSHEISDALEIAFALGFVMDEIMDTLSIEKTRI
jgi:hypothetical protein